jgi:hypothetical protein
MDFKYNAVIVEPRKHKAIEFVINNVCECLSMEWNIIFFHGSNNEDYVKNIIYKNDLFKDRVKLVNLNIDNLDIIEYSKLFATKSIIYDHISSDIFLVFQTDSIIFKKNKDIINDFLEYDYVGAPWIITAYTFTKNCSYIGNGGFSLRRKSKMLEIIDKVEWNKANTFCDKYYNNIYEDLYFSTNYDNIIVNKPEYNKALTFCVDEAYNEVTFACHKPWVHSHYQTFKTIYPEIEILKELQCVETNE